MPTESVPTFIATVNSTRELPLSTVFAAAFATGSSASASPPHAVRPTASATTCRARRTRVICKHQSKSVVRTA